MKKNKNQTYYRFIGNIILLASLVFVLFTHFTKTVYASNSSITWGGGGADNKWSTPGNWVGGVAPGTTDDAIFNVTSVKNATIDASIDVGSIQIGSGYSGTITQASGSSITLEGSTINSFSYRQQAGNFVGGNSSFLSKYGDFEIDNGTFAPTSGSWQLESGQGVISAYNFNGGTINGAGRILNFIDDGSANGGGEDVTCSGNFASTTSLTVNVNTPTSGPGQYRNSFVLEPGCTFTVNTFVAGQVDVPSGATLNVTGASWDSESLGQNQNLSGTVNFSGTGFLVGEADNGNLSGPMTVASGGHINLPNATSFTVQGDFVVSSGGTLTYGGSNVEVDGEYLVQGTFNTTGKNIIFGGDQYSFIPCNGNFNSITGAASVAINKTYNAGSPFNSQFELGTNCSLTISNFNADWGLDQTLTLDSPSHLLITGAVDMGGTSSSRSGGGAILLPTTSTITFTGPSWTSGEIFNGGTFNATSGGPMSLYGGFFGDFSGIGGIFNAPSVINVLNDNSRDTGDIYINDSDGDIFNLGSGTLTMSGFFQTGTGFHPGTGTVVLNGINQEIVNSGTFYNLTKTVSSGDTLSFQNGTTQTINGNLVLQGASGNNLSITSDSTPTQWNLDVEGSAELCYLTVLDSNSTGPTTLQGFQLTDGDSNSNGWNFISAPSCPGGGGGGNATSTDLSVTKVVNHASANVGDTLIYTVVAANSGGLNATGTTVSDILPGGLTLQSSTSTQGSFSGSTWTIGTLATSSTATLTLTTLIGSGAEGTTLTNTAAISSNTPDPNSSNNSSSALTDVASSGGGGGGSVNTGGVTYWVSVTKNGDGGGGITYLGSSCNLVCNVPFKQTIQLYATPDQSSSFASWGGACSGSTSSVCSLLIDGDKFVSVKFNPVGAAAPSTMAGGLKITSPLPFSSNTLVLDKGTIYLIMGNAKIPFTSMKVFTGLGYSLKNVAKGDSSSYNFNGGVILSSASASHPVGSWVLVNKTVCYISPLGLVPVASWDIFLSNGGMGKYLVKADTQDLKLPILTIMETNDTRVGK